MAPTLGARYLLRVTHEGGLFVRPDPTPMPDPSRDIRRVIPKGCWVPAYDILALHDAVYAVLVPDNKNVPEFGCVAEANEYNSATGRGTYVDVYTVAPVPQNIQQMTVDALRDIADAIRANRYPPFRD